MNLISGSGSLSLGNREATWWEVGLGGTPADEDILAVDGWMCAVRVVDLQRDVVSAADAFSKAKVRYCCWMCRDDGWMFFERYIAL